MKALKFNRLGKVAIIASMFVFAAAGAVVSTDSLTQRVKAFGSEVPATPPIKAAPDKKSLGGGSPYPDGLVFGSGYYFSLNLKRLSDLGPNSSVTYLTSINDHNPVFSPNGSTILITSYRDRETGNGLNEIYSMDSQGRDQRRLTFFETNCNQPGYSFSGDGGKIAFTCQGSLYVMNADGTGQEMIASPGFPVESPEFREDGTRIMFTGNGSINFIDPDGTDLVEAASGYSVERARYSRDGTKIVFTANQEVYTANNDGTNIVKVLDDDDHQREFRDASFSPDGTKLLAQCYSQQTFQGDVCTANADGSNLIAYGGTVFEREYPVWSPDGGSIAFIARNSATNRYQIYAAVIGGTPELVHEDDSTLFHLAWQPSCTVGPTPTPTPSPTLPGLISEWNANNSSADDSAGTNNGQILGGAALINPGKVGLGFYFPAEGGYVGIADDPTLDVQSGDYTLSAWFEALGPGKHFVVGKGTNSSTPNNFLIGVDENAHPFIDISHESGGSLSTASDVTLGEGLWHHLVLRKEGQNIKFYVNGEEKISYSEPQPIGTNDGPIRFGTGDGWDAPEWATNSAVDEVRLYGRALTSAEITDIYNGNARTTSLRPSVCTPPVVKAVALRVDHPHPVAAGRLVNVQVELKEPAPPGGAVVDLQSLATSVVTLPATVTVGEGNTSASVQGTTTVASTFRSADITAAYAGDTARATVTVAPAAPDVAVSDLVAPAQADILQNFTATWKVTNNGQAPTNSYRQDTFYISPDDQLFNDQNDKVVGRSYDNAGVLAPGEFKNMTFNQVNIPASAIPADGTYYLFVLIGDAGTVQERGGNYSDNIMSVPITVNRNLPDLVGENFGVPTEIEPNQVVNFTWDIRNAGSQVTNSGATIDAFFSFDQTIGNSDDVQVTGRRIGTMTVGQTLSFSQAFIVPTTPVRPSGNGLFYLKVDSQNEVFESNPTEAAELNNRPSAPVRFEYRVADLQVPSVTPPVEVESDTSFQVAWTTKNFGNKVAGPMYDRVYFSTDQVADGSDVQLGEFLLNQPLDPSQAVDRIQNVTIPTNSITATGNYYVYVRTDASGQVDEGANENNNVRFAPVRVRRLLRPDLRVTNITAPASAFFGQEIQVQWTVTNMGSGPTNAPSWNDRLHLATGANNTGATAMADISNASALNPGESYVTSATVRIPRGFNGSYFFVVRTDTENRVNEENENNNLSSRPITLNIPPLPDLTTSNVQAPEQGFGGQPIAISWTVTNSGTAATPANEADWADAVYLSRDTTLSPDDRYIGERRRSGALAVNGSYTVSGFSVNLPGDTYGDYYVFVTADHGAQMYEFNAEGNNSNYDSVSPGSPLHVLGTPPDLTVLSPISATTAITAGQTTNVQFTTRNQGAFDATGGWTDAVYISADQTFDPQTDTLLGSVNRSNLAAGQQYGNNLAVTIPNCLNGTYYLFAVADVGNRIFEFDAGGNAETNNISQPKAIQVTSFAADLRVTQITVPPVVINGSMPMSWTVKNFGTAATAQTAWTDRVYLVNGTQVVHLGFFDHLGALPISGEYTQNQIVRIPLFLEGEFQIVVRADAFNGVPECSHEENNDGSGNTQVGQDLPDLRIASVSSPGTAVAGSTVNVGWTGRNFSSPMTQPASWADTVYFSTNQTLEYGDLPIGGAVVNSQLATSQSYNSSVNATLPNVTPGTYYLIVNADNGNNVTEGVNETNNPSAAIPITLTAPQVDLRVTSLTADPVVYSGQLTDVSWTVSNTGSTPTGTDAWTDYLVLSRDLVLDPTDTILGFKQHSGVLTGGASYSETRSVQIPAGLTGEYKVFAFTDRNNSVVESDEANNTSVATVDVQLPPPAELNVTSVSPPAVAVIGDNASFSWTVQNSSANAASGSWQDSVYLSTDTTWDSGDILVGQKARTGVLGAFATYTETLTTAVPAVDTGSYYVIVRTDARSTVRESNEQNNVSSSAGLTSVSIQTLTLGNALTTSLATGQERYYSIFNVPADETMLVTLDGQDPSRNELFTRQGSMVSRANYEFQGANQGASDQENVVPNTTAGTYYTMARGDYVPGSFARDLKKADEARAAAEAVTIKAEILPFSVRTVSPAEAGNKGYTFLNIDGAKFQNGASVRLIGPGGVQLAAMNTIYGGPTNLKALFDLRGKAAGNYQVTVTNPNSQTAAWATNFRVRSGGGYDVRSEVNGASEVRAGAFYRYTITTRNQGLNDAIGVPIIVVLSQPLTYRLSTSNYAQVVSEGVDQSTVPVHLDIDGKRFIFLYAPVVRARESVNIGIDIQFGGGADIIATTLPPLFAPDYVLPSQREARASANSGDVLLCYLDLLSKTLLTAFSEIFPADCAGAILSNVYGLMQAAFSTVRTGFDIYSAIGNVLQAAVNVAADCARNLGKYIPWIKALSLLYDLYQLSQLAFECVQKTFEVVFHVNLSRPIDPNEKLGPLGFGPEHWVPAAKAMLYRINFENKPTASAPAQEIRIVDQLPPTLDPRTLRLVEMGFKQYRVEVPANRAFYQTRLQLGPDLNNLKADISAGLDVATGRVTWTFTAVDPQTNEQPLDPFVGLLPPNNAARDGEGYVLFTVQPNSTLPTRTELANKASIFFDENEAIETNVTSNLLDADVPTSACSALPATTADPNIPLTWSGSDPPNGSGFANYDVLVSEDGGPLFQAFARTTDVSGVFAGNWGRTYSFSSITRDNAGNEEQTPETADATITVLGGSYEGDVASRPNGSNDGVIDTADVGQVRRFAARLDTDLQYNEYQRADTAPKADGGDGSLSAADVIQANRFALGLDRTPRNSGPNGPSATLAKPGASSLAPSSVSAWIVSRTGNKLIVGVNLDAQGGESGASFTLTYDPAVLANPANVSPGSAITGGSVAANTSQAGKVGIVVDKPPTSPLAAGTRQIATIEFDVVDLTANAAFIGFTSDIAKNEVANADATAAASSFVDRFIPVRFAPTAALVTVGGVARTPDGRAIVNAAVTLTGPDGSVRRAITNGFGLYVFDGVEAGRSVVVSISHKTYRFVQPTLVVTVDDAVENANFVSFE